MKPLQVAALVLCASLVGCTQQDPDAATNAAGAVPALHNKSKASKAQKIVAPDMIQKDQIVAPDMIQPNTIVAPDMIQPNKIVAPDMVQKDKIVAPDMIQKDKIVAPDMIQPNTIVAPDMVQKDLFKQKIRPPKK